MPAKRDAFELLLIEEADAWFEYLETTRAQTALRYKEVEPWAWARLSQRLRAIKTRRATQKAATEAPGESALERARVETGRPPAHTGAPFAEPRPLS